MHLALFKALLYLYFFSGGGGVIILYNNVSVCIMYSYIYLLLHSHTAKTMCFGELVFVTCRNAL